MSPVVIMSKVEFIKKTLSLGNRLPGFHSMLRVIYGRHGKGLQTEFAGLRLPHPVGIRHGYAKNGELAQVLSEIGFSYIGIDIYDYDAKAAIRLLSSRKENSIVNACLSTAVQDKTESEMMEDVVRSFSLIYDFVDMFTIEVATDMYDIVDEVLSQRLCYDKHVPILVRIPASGTANIHGILDFCMLSGIDGIIAPGLSSVRTAIEYTKGRMPVIGSGDFIYPDEAVQMLRAGAVLLETGKAFEKYGYRTPGKILDAIGESVNQQ